MGDSYEAVESEFKSLPGSLVLFEDRLPSKVQGGDHDSQRLLDT